MYKIISKLLAKRMKRVLPKVIGQTQYVLVGRNLLDNALVEKGKKQKIYVLEKACDFFR